MVDEILNYNYSDIKSIIELQLMLKEKFLNNYNDIDFRLDEIYIGVTVLKGFSLSTNIFYNFDNLEDVINCCIASSHIPFLTGGIINKYNNEITFDGGFSNFPYLNLNNTILNINPSIWDRRKEDNDFINYYDFSLKQNFNKLYKDGYEDTSVNKKKIDKILK